MAGCVVCVCVCVGGGGVMLSAPSLLAGIRYSVEFPLCVCVYDC